MKKRIGSLLLILALCFTLLPTAAFAAEGSGNTASTKQISVRMNAKMASLQILCLTESQQRMERPIRLLLHPRQGIM